MGADIMQILTLTQWETRAADCFSQTRIYKSSQALHLERLARVIHSELNRKHGARAVYSNYVKGFVTGLCRAHDADMMRQHIEFCYIVDSVRYSVDSRSSLPTTRDYCDKVNPTNGGAVLCRDETPRGLFWRDSDKRFF